MTHAPLLKDLPEFKELIDNNYPLLGRIAEIIEREADIDNGEEIDNPNELAILILKEITEFVNDNYTPLKK